MCIFLRMHAKLQEMVKVWELERKSEQKDGTAFSVSNGEINFLAFGPVIF